MNPRLRGGSTKKKSERMSPQNPPFFGPILRVFWETFFGTWENWGNPGNGRNKLFRHVPKKKNPKIYSQNFFPLEKPVFPRKTPRPKSVFAYGVKTYVLRTYLYDVGLVMIDNRNMLMTFLRILIHILDLNNHVILESSTI